MLTYDYFFSRMSAWADISRLWDLVEDSDAIFLLTHTREYRWITTNMARDLGKMLNKSALVLDRRISMQYGVF